MRGQISSLQRLLEHGIGQSQYRRRLARRAGFRPGVEELITGQVDRTSVTDSFVTCRLAPLGMPRGIPVLSIDTKKEPFGCPTRHYSTARRRCTTTISATSPKAAGASRRLRCDANVGSSPCTSEQAFVCDAIACLGRFSCVPGHEAISVRRAETGSAFRGHDRAHPHLGLRGVSRTIASRRIRSNTFFSQVESWSGVMLDSPRPGTVENVRTNRLRSRIDRHMRSSPTLRDIKISAIAGNWPLVSKAVRLRGNG